MGVLGFEPRTSALSELRSSQLSYTPVSAQQQNSQTDAVWPYPPPVDGIELSPRLVDGNVELRHRHFRQNGTATKHDHNQDYRTALPPVNRKTPKTAFSLSPPRGGVQRLYETGGHVGNAEVV